MFIGDQEVASGGVIQLACVEAVADEVRRVAEGLDLGHDGVVWSKS